VLDTICLPLLLPLSLSLSLSLFLEIYRVHFIFALGKLFLYISIGPADLFWQITNKKIVNYKDGKKLISASILPFIGCWYFMKNYLVLSAASWLLLWVYFQYASDEILESVFFLTGHVCNGLYLVLFLPVCSILARKFTCMLKWGQK